MRIARNRVERLEQAARPRAPIEIIFTGGMLERGAKPGPGCFTFVLDDPGFDSEAPADPEGVHSGVRL